MPYKSEKIKIEGTQHDRRRRLTEQQKNEIVSLRGVISMSQCSLIYGVSKRTIDFLWYPERLERNKQLRKQRGDWQQYYNKDKHKENMKNTRHYKQNLFKKGLIKE
jgi:hypothetical protein